MNSVEQYVSQMQLEHKTKFISDYEAWVYGDGRFSDFAHDETRKAIDLVGRQMPFYEAVDDIALECYRWFYHNPTA